MSALEIEEAVREVLKARAQKDVLAFIAFLRANEMVLERGKGYWEDQLYWMVQYKGEYVCFILINGSGSEKKFSPLTIWSDDSNSDWFAQYPLDEPMKEIAWKYVDFCENCGCCGGGTRKTVFGREFENVCRTTMRFINPDTGTLEFVKKMMEIRKNDILKHRQVSQT